MNVQERIATRVRPIWHHEQLQECVARNKQKGVHTENLEVFPQFGKRWFDLTTRNVHWLFAQDCLEVDSKLLGESRLFVDDGNQVKWS